MRKKIKKEILHPKTNNDIIDSLMHWQGEMDKLEKEREEGIVSDTSYIRQLIYIKKKIENAEYVKRRFEKFY